MALKFFPRDASSAPPQSGSGAGKEPRIEHRDALGRPKPVDSGAVPDRGTTQGGALSADLWAIPEGLIEVVEPPVASPSLENAALMFAHGNAAAALAALRHAIEGEDRKQPFVWLCLFDLLARAGDRAAFDELALRYVVEFERSAPAWDDLATVSDGSAPADPSASPTKGKILLRGDLCDPRAPNIAALTELSRKKPEALRGRIAIDVSDLRSADDVCGTLVAGALAALRRKGAVIAFRGLSPLVNRLSAALETNKASIARGQWYLTLELMQWADREGPFEDLAVEFAVQFGLSPPSWEPLTPAQRAALSAASEATPAQSPPETPSGDLVRWQGELRGAHDPRLRSLDPERIEGNALSIDMSRVIRIDFICAGELANAIVRVMARSVEVRLVNASPIIQALLQLTGVPSHLFVRVATRR
ncbi:MAG: STAS domain-containing protein [Casimicrobiaceae bacterium]|nr:STAS domain-containing protein [Casimicrobiaceae bacterium]